MLEVVEVVNLLGGEDATADGLGIETLDVVARAARRYSIAKFI